MNRLSETIRIAGVLVTLLATFSALSAPDAVAQNQNESVYGLTESGAANPLTLLRQRLASSVSTGVVSPLEGAVDPASYYVGPGDQFTVSVAGQDITPTPVRVGADGRIVLPGAGTVNIGGLTLDDARERLLESLRRAYTNTAVDISLAQSRQFYVHVSGAVPTPSRYLALPVSRVSSVLELAFADTTRAPVKNPDFRPSLRNIRLVHRDGTEDTVDLLRYYSGGNTEANPFLRDGDVVFVPAFNPDYSSVYVGGAVPFPGAYDYREGDTILDVIQVAGGIVTENNVAQVRLQQISGDEERSEQIFSVRDVLEGQAGDTPIGPRDHVSVQPRNKLLGSAQATGMLQHPGTYPIVDGSTTVLDLIDAAGGVRDDALLRGAYIERRSLPTEADRRRPGRFDLEPPNLGEILAADTTQIMRSLRLTNLDFMSRAYFAQETRLQNRVSVDLEAVISGTEQPATMRTSDRLVIPRDQESVYVIGQVDRPGYVSHEPNRDAGYYIAAAGGRGEFASDAYIVHPATGAFSSSDGREIRSGDVIFVDRTVDIADNPELQRLVLEESRVRKDARIRTTQAVAQAISSIATVIALIVTLRNN